MLFESDGEGSRLCETDGGAVALSPNATLRLLEFEIEGEWVLFMANPSLLSPDGDVVLEWVCDRRPLALGLDMLLERLGLAVPLPKAVLLLREAEVALPPPCVVMFDRLRDGALALSEGKSRDVLLVREIDGLVIFPSAAEMAGDDVLERLADNGRSTLGLLVWFACCAVVLVSEAEGLVALSFMGVVVFERLRDGIPSPVTLGLIVLLSFRIVPLVREDERLVALPLAGEVELE